MELEERNKLIEDIYNTGLIQNYIKKLAYKADLQEYDDILQECWIQICEIKPERWEELLSQGKEHDKYFAVRGYISGIVYRQVRSRNSKIYAKFKKHKEYEIMQTAEQWEKLENIADTPFDFESMYIQLIDVQDNIQDNTQEEEDE